MVREFGGRLSRAWRRLLGASITVLAMAACLDDAPTTAGIASVRALLSANVVGAVAGSTVRIRIGYRTSREGFVALPSSPTEIAIAAGTTVVVPVTVDLGPCLADPERVLASEGGCQLTLELTLADASGNVVDTQTRDARGGPVNPGESVDFGSVTIGVSVSTITVAPASLGMNVTQEQQLTATVRDASGAVTTAAQVTWTTTDATVAQLSAPTGGSVTVRALKLGAASVTASAGGKTSNPVAVNVVPPAPLVIRQNPTSGCVIVGQTVTLVVDTPPGPITWSMSNPAIATIGASNGLVTGVAQGQATVTALSGLRVGTATVCVVGPLVVTPSSVAITAGRTAQLTATNVSGGAVSYASSAPAIATVDAAGLVRGVGVGQATITTTLTAASGTQTVTTPVSVAAAAIVIAPSSGTAPLNQTARFTATVQDANGATLPNVAVTWSITDATIGSLSTTSGVAVDVRALKVGTTTVRATLGTVSSSAQFTATQPLPASRLEKVSGDGASCATRSSGCTFVVRAVDVNGIPVGGASIGWSGPSGCPAGPVTTSDANGLASAANVCLTLAPGKYTQTATLFTTQQQAVFTYTMDGLTLAYSSDTNSVDVRIGSSLGTAQGLVPSVRYVSGPINNYITSMRLNQTFTPATLVLSINFFQLPFGTYTFELTVTTTTAGLGPAVQTFTFSTLGAVVPASVQRLDPR
jgi:uncharacterized protein YjdB